MLKCREQVKPPEQSRESIARVIHCDIPSCLHRNLPFLFANDGQAEVQG